MNLYVGNLSFKTTDITPGTIPSARTGIGSRVVMDRDYGHSKGFGFVEIANSTEAGPINVFNGTDPQWPQYQCERSPDETRRRLELRR
jgi:RNA recognition motif-containing protein